MALTVHPGAGAVRISGFFPSAARFLRAAGDSIAQRGKTQVGDKTIVDAIMPAADALDAASP
jgi:dihydroxyacetone kinase